MNPFSVSWTDDALDSLALLWMHAANPADVSRAQVMIDSLLARGPLHHGTELSEGLRELTVPPLRVLYSVDDVQRMVDVSSVRFS